MGFFTVVQETVEIDEENTITIRPLTYGEGQALQSRCMKLSAEVGGKGASAAVAILDAPLMEQMTWESAIVAWAGPGFEGKPVTPANIRALPSFVLEKLKKPFDRLSGFEEEAKNDSAAPTN